jgi:anti-sigma regulatory factor (Ser/Thr protein kinase)
MAEPDAPPHIEVSMFSQPRLLAPVRTMVGSFAQRIGFSEILCGQISLAIDEALCNIINHGYDRQPDGTIRIRLWDLELNPPALRIVVEDRAKQVDLESIQPRDLDDIRPGGLGVFIIREVMDEVNYEHRAGGGMRLSMMKQVSSDNEEGSVGAEASGCQSETKK